MFLTGGSGSLDVFCAKEANPAPPGSSTMPLAAIVPATGPVVAAALAAPALVNMSFILF